MAIWAMPEGPVVLNNTPLGALSAFHVLAAATYTEVGIGDPAGW
jgi:hypothetical protein